MSKTPQNSAVPKRGILKPSTRENLRIYWYNFRSNKLSIIGLIIVVISIFLALFPQAVTHYPEHVKEFVDFANAGQAPNSVYWFGTDTNGRDIFTRVIYSFRGAMLMSVVVLAISVPVGTALGLIAGYYHGTKIDTVIMRVTDVFLSMPPLILCLAIASMLEYNMMNSMLAITIMWWPWYTRLVYSSTVSLSEEYFVKEAELIGASKLHILVKEILPNCLSPILTKMALDVGEIWLKRGNTGYYTQADCPVHGPWFLRFKLSRRDGLHWNFARCIEAARPDALEKYLRQKARQEARLKKRSQEEGEAPRT